MTGGERRWALAVSAVLLAAVALPGLRLVAQGRDAPDGFPLSTYPMFTRDPGRVVDLPTVVGVSPDGDVHRLSPRVIADTDQVIQANEVLRRAVRQGGPALRELCREAAGRVDPGRVATVAVVVERHDAIDWAAGDREPRERRTLVDCPAGAP
jgi:hypothetical protein